MSMRLARVSALALAQVVLGAACGGNEVPAPDGGAAALALEPDSVNLGEIDLGEPVSATWLVRNVGTGAAQIQHVDVGDSGELVVLVDTCTGSLASGESCTLQVSVRPARAGRFAAEVAFHTASGDLVGHLAAVGRAMVTVEVIGDTGRVTSEPSGIACGASATACSATFTVPEVVLRASDDMTVRWSGGCAGNGECRLELTGPIVVTASMFDALVVLVEESPPHFGFAYGVAIDPLNRMIVTGEGPGPLTAVAWTSALAPDGRIEWTDRFDPGAEGHDTGYAVDVADDGGIIVVGQWYSSSWTRWNAFIRKLAPSGAWIWGHESEEIGDDAYRGIAVDHATGAIYVVGFRPDPSTILPAVHVQGVIRRLDATGQLAWERTWQGSAEGDDLALDVALDSAGNVLVVGRTAAVARGADAWIAAYSTDGDLRWSEQRGGDGDDELAAVAVAPDGSFVVAGGQAGVGWIARYSAAHQLIAERWTPEVASWQGAAFTESGELVVTGGEQTRAYTVSLEPVWTHSYRALHATDVTIDHADNVVVVGWVGDALALIKYFQ